MTFPAAQAIHFGPYRVYPEQRRVMDTEQPVRLGRPALDILLILLAHAGQVVSKQTLIAGVWPKSVVEDINLRVHMAALRKALGDGQNGQRFIITVAQRGYSFVAPYSLEAIEGVDAHVVAEGHNLPVRHTRMLGRQPLVERLIQALPRQRFISLVGPGGIGKTTVALRVAEHLIGRYRDGIGFLDLAALTDPQLITAHLATLLELSLHDGDPIKELVAFLSDRQMLLVIDNCEHVVDAIAVLCEDILRGAPQVHILATSRESLRAEGEFVQRLGSLDCPPPSAAFNRAHALSFSALQLFIERAMTCQDSFELNDAQLPLAIDICQRLDGIPLAIELAAGHVAQLGLAGLLSQLQSSFSLLAQSSHSPLHRHQTLHATLDWSFDLLTAFEQTCLRRLSVFRSGFTVKSAAAVIGGEVLGAITQLVAKSLLNVEIGDEDVFYRLLDTTRSYALEKLDECEELTATRMRHAERCLELMQYAGHDWELVTTSRWIERYARGLDDVRGVLDWGLNGDGPQALAIRLAAHSAPLWQELSLLKEHGHYVRKALLLLNVAPQPQPELEMTLKLALGSACYHTQGGTAETIDAFVSALILGQQCNHVSGQLRAVSGHMAVNLSCGNYQRALEQSREFDLLGLNNDAVLALSTDRLRGLALHFSGDQGLARVNAEGVIQRMAHSGHRNRFTHGFGVQYDQSVAALTILARILWLQGQPEQAWRTARQALDIALQINHGNSICYTLALGSCLIAHCNGDTLTARKLLRLLLEQAQKHSVLLFYTWARHYAQVIDSSAAPAPAQPGTGLIKDIVLTLDASKIDDQLLLNAKTGAAGWCTAEILRAKAQALLVDDPARNANAAQALLLNALTVARTQSALAWELRTATSLAQLWQQQGRNAQAHTLLAPIYNRFTEGLATPDLVWARQVLHASHGRKPGSY